MTVKELITILQTFAQDKEIVLHYETEVVYSEYTSGLEDMIEQEDMIAKIDNEEMIFDTGLYIVIAADLSNEETEA